jgi:hypothetical protein
VRVENKHVLSPGTLDRRPKTSFFFAVSAALFKTKVLLALEGVFWLHGLKSHWPAVLFFWGLWKFRSAALVLLQPHLHTASAQQEQQGDFLASTGSTVWSNMIRTVSMPMDVFNSVFMRLTSNF